MIIVVIVCRLGGTVNTAEEENDSLSKIINYNGVLEQPLTLPGRICYIYFRIPSTNTEKLKSLLQSNHIYMPEIKFEKCSKLDWIICLLQ